jgi:TamB, inner membrane protein subunit of TAM complex
MRRLARIAIGLTGFVIIALAVIALALSIPVTRSVALNWGLRVLVWHFGFHWAGGHVTYAKRVLTINHLALDDDRGEEFLDIRRLTAVIDPLGFAGRSDRQFGIHSIAVDEPHIFLRHRSDGTWNFTRLIPRGPAPKVQQAGLPWRLRTTIARGEIEVIDPQSHVAIGEEFSLAGLEAAVSVDQGATSTGQIVATLQSKKGATPMRAMLFENDRLSFARFVVEAKNLLIAPVMDTFLPSTAFIAEAGVARFRLHAFAIGYTAQPRWHFAGDATIDGARLRVTPLILPVRDLHCKLHFNDGLLTISAIRGEAGGIPITGQGGLQLAGIPRLMFVAQPHGRLERAKNLFTFALHQDVAGPFSAAIRVDGPISTIRVAGYLESSSFRFQDIHLPLLRSTFYFNQGHMTVQALDLASGGAKGWFDGDFDVQSRDATTQAAAAVIAPAKDLPFIANVMPDGTVEAIAQASGPFAQLNASGYVQVTGPSRSIIRAFLSGGPDRVAFGPMLYQAGSSEALAWADRTLATRPSWSGAIIATHFPLEIRPGRVTLADVTLPPLGLPSLDTTLNGAGFVFQMQPGSNADVAVDAQASSLVYDHIPLGDAAVQAGGNAGNIFIRKAAINGPAMTASAQGVVALNPGLKPTSGVLHGSMDADLGAFASAFSSLHPRGRSAGVFVAAYDGTQWIASARASSADASVGNLALRQTTAFVEASRGNATMLGDVVMPGSAVWAFGTLATRSASAGEQSAIDAFFPRLDLRSLAPLGLREANGTASGFASLRGSKNQPAINAAAALHGSYDNIPYNGDLDLQYAGGKLSSRASRIAVLGNQLTVDGSVSGVAPGVSLSNAALTLRVRLREGDLAAISRFTGKNAPVTGSYDADAAIGGKVTKPDVDARIDTDIGTIRGVAFNELHGSVRLRPGEVSLSNGSVELGTSEFGLQGEATPVRFSVSAKSPHVDMSDFNDFFGGADVFGGDGSFGLALSSAGHGLLARGNASLADAAFYDYRLGRIDTTFSSTNRGGLNAVVNQSGPGGSMQVAGFVDFLSYHGGFPNFATARYGVRAHVRDLQMDEVLPLMHREQLGVSGLLDADGALHGTLRKPSGNVTFSLRNGYLRRIPLEDFSGELTANQDSLTLRNAVLQLPFLVAKGAGSFGFTGRKLNGSVSLEAADLASLASGLRLPGTLRGSASGKIDVAGTLESPSATADLSAEHASFYNVAVDEAKLHAVYGPGEVSFGDSSLTFAGKRGTISVTGALPVQLKPLALGPKDRPLNVSMSVAGMDLSVLDPITSKYARLNGKLDAQASVSGTAGNPIGKGSARMANASVESDLETVPITNASGDLLFENDTITLQHVHGSVGTGAVDIAGAAHIVPALGLRTYAGLQLWSRVNFGNTQVNFPNWISGTLGGHLSFTRSGTIPYLAGDVAVSNSTVPFAAIYALAEGGAVKPQAPSQVPGVPALQPDHTIVYGGGLWGPETHTLTNIGKPTPKPTGFSIPSLNLDVTTNAGNNVRIRGGSSIDLTTTGNLTITGNLQSPTLAGQFRAIRGQVGYFDTTFRLVSGTVTFDPTSGLLPSLNATAVTNVSGAQITLTVTGRVDNLSTDLESNPPMARDDIIAALLHTSQVSALTSFNPTQTQATLVQTAQNYFNAQLSRSLLYPVESALAQQLNIESISLIFNQYGELAIEVRTSFTPDVSAVYQSSVAVPVTSAYGMSYRLQDYLALDVLQTSRPDYGLYSTVFNLHYTFR